MKYILVFGGSGFLGTYLITELINREYYVVNADIKNNNNLKCEYIECNINNIDRISKVINKYNYDYVYNLAGFANMEKAVKFPQETIQLNINGNLNILDACKNKQIKRFIFASSAYAMSNKGSFYAISKLASEKLVEEYQIKYGLNYSILRYGSVYSEMPYDNNYIYDLVLNTIKTNKILHKGDGNEIREYIHASDAAKLSVDIIEDVKYTNKHIILTGNEKIRRIDLFYLIKEILNKNIEIDLDKSANVEHYKYTPYSFTPNYSIKLLPNPHIDMGQGIVECIKNVLSSSIKFQ